MAESGHVKNVANLQTALNFATGWGGAYKPSNAMLSTASMATLIATATAEINGVQSNRTPWRNATSAAEDAFAPLSKLIRRVMKSAKSQGVPASVIEDADTYARKILGVRKVAITPDDPNTPDVDESSVHHSASQMSRNQRIENLESLVLLLSSQPLYKPNETELQTATLQTLVADLTAKTEAVGTNFVPYSNSMASRDDVLYINDDAVVKVGRLFKLYVDSAFGRGSTEWNQIKSLEFTTYTRK